MVGAASWRSGDRAGRGLTDAGAVGLAVAAWFGAAVHRPGPLPVAILLVAAALVARRPWLLGVAVMALASVLGARAVAGLAPVDRSPFRGEVTLVTDPEGVGDAIRVDVRAAGDRLEAWARGPAAVRLRGRLAGEVVTV